MNHIILKQGITMKQLKTSYLLLIMILSVLFSCEQVNNTESLKHKQNEPVNLKLIGAKVFVTAENTPLRLQEMSPLKFEPLDQPEEHFPTIILDANKTFQAIVGFGGAITDAAAETFYKLPKDKQEEILTSYFDPVKGIGYSLCRTHINSCDFSSESYAYDEVEGDAGLAHFSINHDKKFRIPLTKAAIKKTDGKLRFFASPWSPPAWMKTNNNMLHGGKLKPRYYQSWANYYVKFFQAYQQEGIPIWGLTVQNEPMAVQTWESCIYTAKEERDFVKDYLGPTLEKAGMGDKKIIIWDHNRGIMYQRAEVVYNDPRASKYVWGTGFHWYTGDHFENVKAVHEAFPDKKLLFTEGCVFPFDYSKLNEWQWGERYGESIINDLNNSASGWVDWNILVDENGGPNHVANYCFAPIVGNTKTGEVTYMNSFHYLGHFSKFIRPGAQRIACTSNSDDLMATAMLNPDGSIAVVALNLTDKKFDYKIWINDKALTTTCLPHSISTIIFN